MLSQWVSRLKTGRQLTDTRFRRSLVRNVLIVLLLSSLFPILLIGALNMVRSREMLRQQASYQADNILAYEINQINRYVDQRTVVADRLAADANFRSAVATLLTTPSTTQDNLQARTQISYSFRGNPRTAAEGYFDQMVILRPDGSVALATNERWVVENFGSVRIRDPFILKMLGQPISTFAFLPQSDKTDRLDLYMARPILNMDGKQIATLLTTATTVSTDITFQSVSDTGSFMTGAQGFFFKASGELDGIDKQTLRIAPGSQAIAARLTALTTGQKTQSRFDTTYNKQPTIAYARWMNNYNLGIVLVVSQAALYRSAQLVDPFNIILLIVALALSGGLIYYFSTTIVNPLVKLSQAVDGFSHGNWSERIRVNRADEIGLLAHSFNHMADDLSALYRSLELAVEDRTSSLRVASEVAQLATSTVRLGDTLGRTVELIAERFGFYYVAIYLYDHSRQNLVLQEASGSTGAHMKKRGDRVPTTQTTLITWVAENRQSKVISETQADALFRANDLLPDTLSEAAIPIILNNEVLGVLDIQSTNPGAFTDETVAVFQTLANQISSTLQATRLLESTQVSYQETSLLYRATRQVTQARGETEIIEDLTETFLQLPYTTAILSVEHGSFRIEAITDSKTGQVEKSLQNMAIPVGKMARLLEENRVVLVEDLTQLNEYNNILSFLLRRGIKTAALLAVLENGALSKVLIISSRESGEITNASLQLYANLTDVVGAALEKFSALSTLQARLSELQILSIFSRAISAETDIHDLYRVLYEQIRQTVGEGLEFAVAIYNASQNLIEFPFIFEEGQQISIPPAPLGQGLTSTVIQSRQPLLLPDERSVREHGGIITGLPARSWLGVPLVFAGESYGALLVQDLHQENRFSVNDLNLLMTLAPQIATAVRNVQLYTETQQALRAYDQERFLLNTLLENMPEGISFKDPQGRYIRASHSIARVYGLDPAELVGKTEYDLADRENADRETADRETADQVFHDEQAVQATGSAEVGLIQSRIATDGKETWLQTSRIPIRTASGDPYGLLVIQRDVTELKEAEGLAQRRADQVTTAAEIARDATGTLDVKTLLDKSINLVRDRFGYYHASIFLLDPTGEYAVLRQSTGEAGQKMMQAGHRLAVGSKSIVGQVTENGSPLIVNDVNSDPTHLPNPLLPDTRSEMALPLQVGDRILGALDVQSTKIDAFNPEDISVLQILADQLAVAVVNGELFARAQELLGKHRLLRQITIAASSSTSLEDTLMTVVSGLRTAMVSERIAFFLVNEEGLLQIRASSGYEGTLHEQVKVTAGKGITGQAAVEKRPILVNDTLNDARYIALDTAVRSELAIPILFGDELIGVLNLESTRASAFDENDLEILGALGNNLGGVIANVRLVNQVRTQVIRERQLFDVTSKIRHSIDMEEILETSAKEIARAMGARRASIRINPVDAPSAAVKPATPPQNGKSSRQEDKA